MTVGSSAAEVVRIVELERMVAKIQHNAGLAIGHEPFFRMGLGSALPIPEAFHK